MSARITEAMVEAALTGYVKSANIDPEMHLDWLRQAIRAALAAALSTEPGVADSERLWAYAHEATKAITDIVGGGSECFAGRIGKMYIADLPYCKKRVRDRESNAHGQLLKSIQDARSAKAANSWRTDMENAPKDGTVVNVVGRYPDATAGFPRYAAFLEEDGDWFELSRNKPERVIPWAWRPRDDWPQEAATRSALESDNG
jgi:hypothetical protein